MKRIVGILVGIILLSSQISLAADVDTLQAKDFEKEFIQQIITIEPIGIMTSSNINWGQYLSESWRRWEAYKGFIKISEAEFFRITGYRSEARQASSYKSTSNGLIFGGLVIDIIGIVLIAYSFGEETTYDPYWGWVEEPKISYGLLTGGMILSSFGTGMTVWGLVRLRKNWAPYSIAEDIAKKYNSELRIQIQKQF